MNPIIIIDDDQDDQEILRRVFEEMNIKNEIIKFYNGFTAFEYLSRKEVTPFLIFSDINMPVMNGFELQEKIHSKEEIRIKCIPFIFLTTGGNSRYILEAYSHHVQGFFIKPNNMNDWTIMINTIFQYWESSRIPHGLESSQT